jgi:uncharacterized protein (DUF4415 family)
MPTKRPRAASEWVDSDNAPHLTREWFERADLYHGDKVVRGGRPKSASPTEAVNLRLDADVLKYFRKTGPGWQSRINEALRKGQDSSGLLGKSLRFGKKGVRRIFFRLDLPHNPGKCPRLPVTSPRFSAGHTPPVGAESLGSRTML